MAERPVLIKSQRNRSAIPSVEGFDPVALRCEVLRRVAREASRRMVNTELFGGQPHAAPAPAAAANTQSRNAIASTAPDAGQAPQLSSTVPVPAAATADARPSPTAPLPAATSVQTNTATAISTSSSTAPVPAATTTTDAQSKSATATAVSGASMTSASARTQENGSIADAVAVRTAVTEGSPISQVFTACSGPSPSCNVSSSGQDDEAHQECSKKAVLQRRWRRAQDHVRQQVATWVREAKLSIFLAFPSDSFFNDPNVEELYQTHHMHQWSPRLEWSSVALFQMLLWDLVSSQRYRMLLVLHFYMAFVTMVFLHTTLFVAIRADPQWWRISRGVLLCGFLVGRGFVCHPFLSGPLPATEVERKAFGLHATTSLIGIGMTNLSGFLALQLHTLDTLLLCIAHGTTWCWVMLCMPSDVDSWLVLLAGHLIVSCVCVWQQREQERFERISFEEELLMERSLLLRSSDCLVRRGTQVDFRTCMSLLHRSRMTEHLNL